MVRASEVRLSIPAMAPGSDDTCVPKLVGLLVPPPSLKPAKRVPVAVEIVTVVLIPSIKTANALLVTPWFPALQWIGAEKTFFTD